MILRKAIISNYRGINGSITVNFDLFNCIVGQNDAGKSTILKAIDASLNETNLTRSDYNVQATENIISVELKATTKLEDVHFAQAINYLEAYNLEIGLLVNFGETSLNFKKLTNKKFKAIK